MVKAMTDAAESPTEGPLSGGCLCGGVRYRYDGLLGARLGAVTVCHCSQCLKAQGVPAAAAPVAAAGFAVEAGASLIREFESSPGKKRAFCSHCGSPLYSRREGQPQSLRLRLGSLDHAPEGLEVTAHIFVADAPAWSMEHQAPRYPRFEPGRGG
jgi:hypothetical protein